MEGEGIPGIRNSLSNSGKTRCRKHRESKGVWLRVMNDGEGGKKAPWSSLRKLGVILKKHEAGEC